MKIATLYESTVLKNAQVLLSVKSFRSQTINVFGAVSRPGAYPLNSSTRIIDVLSLVGGLTDKAVPKAIIRRPSAGPIKATEPSLGSQEDKPRDAIPGPVPVQLSYGTIEIDLAKLLHDGDLSLNIQVLGGDVITVPERQQQFVFVLGDVKNGGAFEIKRDEQLTVQHALALSGGFLSTAKPTKAVIIRSGKTLGESQQIPVNAVGIFKGKQKDVVLQASDIVLVPGSASKTIGRSVLGSLQSIASSAILYGLIYK